MYVYFFVHFAHTGDHARIAYVYKHALYTSYRPPIVILYTLYHTLYHTLYRSVAGRSQQAPQHRRQQEPFTQTSSVGLSRLKYAPMKILRAYLTDRNQWRLLR